MTTPDLSPRGCGCDYEREVVHAVLKQLREGNAWSEWQALQGCGREERVPITPGLYRVRLVSSGGEVEVVYIGETDRLRTRLGMFRGVFDPQKMPYRSPHAASPALWAFLDLLPAADLQVSVFQLEGISERVRKGFECVAIAFHRQQYGTSLRANFSRMPLHYRMSSYNTARLVEQQKRFRGGKTQRRDRSHLPGIAPVAPFTEEAPDTQTWCGHNWSEWQSARERIPYTGRGLYRLRVPGQAWLVYLGWGKVQEGVRRQVRRVAPSVPLECSWVEEDRYDHQFQELHTDLLASHLLVTAQLPCLQFQRKGQLTLCSGCPLSYRKDTPMRKCTAIPQTLYRGLIVLHVQGLGFQTIVERVTQVYPTVETERALNWQELEPEIRLETLDDHPAPSSSADGYYLCPSALAHKAQFATSLSERDAFLLRVQDWQTYAAQNGNLVIRFQLDGDHEDFDETLENAEDAWGLYQAKRSSYRTFLLWLKLFERDNDTEPIDEHCLLVNTLAKEDDQGADIATFNPRDFLGYHRLSDGRFLTVGNLVGRRAFLGISHFPPFDEDSSFADQWQFPSVRAALTALREWDPTTQPEPQGWDRHPRTSRRRPGGDPKKEVVRE